MKNLCHIQAILAFVLLFFCSCEKDLLTENPVLSPGEVLPGDESLNRIDNPYWTWARDFPGNVHDTVTRLQNVGVTIDGNYTPWTATLISVRPSAPLVSTGLYAPVAEIVTVQVPEGVEGLKYQIGIYSCVISDTMHRDRYSVITKYGDLVPGENKIFNYFGGHLYITFKKPIPTPFNLVISGAVKSPDFILGKTDPEAWKKEVATTGVPWGEIGCKNMIMTMPVADLRKVADPVALMEYYEDFITEDYDVYSGFTPDATDLKHRSPSFPWRFCTDKQLCLGAGHNGYPFLGGLSWGKDALTLSIIQDGGWGIYHELGHNYQTNTWKWDALGEVSNNLHAYRVMNRKFGKWFNRDINFEYVVNTYINDPENIAWEFVDLDVFHKLTPFLQIAQEYGWGFYSYLAKEGRENGVLSRDQDKIDFFARKLTEYSHYNMTDFFKAWHLPASGYTEAYMSQFDAVPTRFWEKFDMARIPAEFTERAPLKKGEPEVSDVELNRTTWVATTSSNRPNSEGKYALDNDPVTKWYADWNAAASQVYPHWMRFDLKGSKEFNYIYFIQSTQSPNTTRPRKITVSVSDNGTAWTVVKTVALDKTSGVKQRFDIARTSAKFIQLDMITPNPVSGDPSDKPGQAGTATMAEFGVGLLNF